MARINDALWDLREAYRAEGNPDRKQRLQDEYDRALDAVLELTGKTLGENTAAYESAVDALDQSIADLRSAKKELGDVAEAIRRVAKAVGVVVEVASKVAV
jgi:chaperonin cofactor prefoldin